MSAALASTSRSLLAAPASHNFRGDAQTSLAFAPSMSPFAAPAGHNFRGDAQTPSAFASASMSSFAAPGSHDARGESQTLWALARTSTSPLAAPANDISRSFGFAEFAALASLRLPDSGFTVASARAETRPMADTFAPAATSRGRSRSRSRFQSVRVVAPNLANELVRSAVAARHVDSLGAGHEGRTLQQDSSLVEAQEGGNEARQQMENDHLLALRLQHAERRTAVLEMVAERRRIELERHRAMQERRRAATRVALATNTAEVVHTSIPKQCDGDSQQDQCSVCLEKFQDGEQLRLLPCMHKYHSRCIDKWFQNSPACPVCKHSIIPSTSTASASQGLVIIDS